MRLKHIAAFLLGTALTVSMIPAFVFAKEIDVKAVDRDVTQSSESGNGEDVIITVTPPPQKPVTYKTSDNDKQLEDYFKKGVENKLGKKRSTRKSSSSAGANLKGNDKTAYEYLKTQVALIAAGTEHSTEIDMPFSVFGIEKTEFTADDLGVSSLLIYNSQTGKYKINPDASNAMYGMISFSLRNVIDALLADCPYELYWFDKTKGFGYKDNEYPGINYSSDALIFDGTITIVFPVSLDYSAGEYLTDGNKINRVNTAISTAASIVGNGTGKSDYQKLVFYRNEICNRVTYDHDAPSYGSTRYGDPWQLISVFDNNTSTNVVCEGYSKAFMYLCELSTFDKNISCILATGVFTAPGVSGDHMWNIVTMGDGKNYLVDVTNCDAGSSGYPDKLFLIGYSAKVTDGYDFVRSEVTYTYVYDEDTTGPYTADQLAISSHDYQDTEYSLTLNKPANVNAFLSKTKAYAGDEITVNYTAPTGYELDSITVVTDDEDVIANNGNKFIMPSKDVTVTVTFKKINYTITVNKCTNGTATVENNTANYGDLITITITPDTCYELDTVTVNNAAVNYHEFNMPAENVTITVAFKANHTIVDVPEKLATCTEDGYEAHYKCSECDKLFSDAEGTNVINRPKVINKLGHKWNDGTVTKEPTCEDKGVKTYTCSRCKGTTTEDVDPLGHKWNDGTVTKEATCTETGTKHFECTRDGCNKTKDDTIEALGHKLKHIDEQPATKTAEGYLAHYKCERCGKLFSDNEGKNEITLASITIPMLTHDLTAVPAKAATCTEDGYKAHYECQDEECQGGNKCGKKYEDKYGQKEVSDADIKVAALGHDPQTVDKKDPTCTANGYEKHYKCSRCKKLFSDANGENEISEPKAIAKLGHDLKHVEAKAETYKEDGNIEYYYCNRCKKYFRDHDCKNEIAKSDTVIPKKGSAVLNEEAPAGDNMYKVTNPATDGTGTVTFTGVVTKKSSVSIPSTVEIKGSIYKVVRIGYKAFYKNTTIKTLSIGSNVKYIDSYAFYGCKNLTKVSGGNNLLSIGTKAFAYCSKLKSFSISSAVLKKISPYTFQKDKKLKTITIKQTTKLTKAGVKKSLKGSKVKKIKVKKSKVKAYKKIFKKSNSGRSVKVKK